MPDFNEIRSLTLSALIQEEINQKGPIPFELFMGFALYHPELGYYCSNSFRLGEKGDFTTAPEISPLFAKCMARQFQELSAHIPNADILEMGAGSGRFAGEILSELDRLGNLPAHYYISEISPSLIRQQKALIEKQYPAYLKHCIWLEELPDSFNGMIFANEVLDALPFHCFKISDNDIKERRVSFKDGRFQWELTPASDEIEEAVEALQLPKYYESEINLQYRPLIHELAETLEQGIILFIDYGYGQREYYHPQRNRGTLTCFYQHRHHDDPLILPGLQDITAHVDFTRVIESASDAGLELLGFTTQTSFLLSCGLLNITMEEEKTLNEVEKFKLHQAIKTLTMPTEMGERIKIMGLGKNVELPTLMGFSLQDRRRDL